VLHLRVFITTAIISMWAYIWMLVVYLWWTPSEVRCSSSAAMRRNVCTRLLVLQQNSTLQLQLLMC
jgi:hypothetical protein